MILAAALLLGLQATSAPVPGQCTAPAAAHVGEPGCYLSAEFDLASPAGTVYWHVYTFPSVASAKKAAATLPQAVVTEAHGKLWLHVIGAKDITIKNGTHSSTMGPLIAPTTGRARILESWFPPGMITRAHSHPGTEVFYVVEGEQCVETPQGGKLIPAGNHYVVEQGPHLQAAPQGRRSLVLLLLPKDIPWMALEQEWKPTGFCSRPGQHGTS
jgi:quercetin dioxygenase-like cupin family protein